jgi:endonuclease/exonuclease/phosphatase family metal-dependent hydrolase
VVALQEAFRFHAETGLPHQPQELAERLGLPHVAVGWNVTRRRGVYGNATLSRLPLAASMNLDLRWRFKKRRSALYSRVLVPGRPLHLFNVHLGLAHFERAVQMRRLTAWSRELAPRGEPVVIAGDTNDWLSRLAGPARDGDDFECAGAGRGRRARGTFPAALPLGALDRLFLRGGVRVIDSYAARGHLARSASDHLPLVTDVEIEPGSGAVSA